MAYKRDKAFMTHKLQLPGDSKKDVTSRNICLEITFHTEFQLTFKSIIHLPSFYFHSPCKSKSINSTKCTKICTFKRLSHLVNSTTNIILIFIRILALKSHGEFRTLYIISMSKYIQQIPRTTENTAV